MMKKILGLLMVLCLLLVVGCEKKELEDDIYIFYTSDVHCGVSDNIGYAGLKAMVDDTKAEHQYVTLVDCGDHLQGGTFGTFSKGSYIIEMMNEAGYDIATFGNHEFDYGIDELKNRINESQFDYIACNTKYTGSGESVFKDIPDYVVIEYGPVKVAFIGVLTPESITTSTPKFFMENGKFVYDFYSGNNGQDLYDRVQSIVDEAKADKVDYVVAVTHLGSTNIYTPYDAISLISHTNNIDVVLDGHSHSTIIGDKYPNKDGKDVILSSVGTKFQNVGELIIGKDGTLETLLISEYDKKDEAVNKLIDEKQAAIDQVLSEELCELDYDMMMYDEDGIRISRSRETTVGNFMADAFRYALGTDIAFVNGGAIRNNILKGTITYGDLFNVAPFQNNVASVEATGQQILDGLEYSVSYMQKIYKLDDKAVGEFGGLLLSSGLKYTVDTSIESPTLFDDANFCIGFKDGERRVKDVYVLEGDIYVPLDPNKTYTVGGTNYVLLNSGDGNTIFKDCKPIIENGITDVEALYHYLKDRGGFKEDYSKLEGRLIVK